MRRKSSHAWIPAFFFNTVSRSSRYSLYNDQSRLWILKAISILCLPTLFQASVIIAPRREKAKRNNLRKKTHLSLFLSLSICLSRDFPIRGNEIFSLREKLEARTRETSELAPRIIQARRVPLLSRARNRAWNRAWKKNYVMCTYKRKARCTPAMFSSEFRLIEFAGIAVAPLSPTGPICEFSEAYRALNSSGFNHRLFAMVRVDWLVH